MAGWVYQRPVDCCHPTELVVAKRLARLGDEWVIRWGFYYETDREGDFIVLGPTGGVLVLEVKGGDLRKLSTVGRWENSSLDHQWRSFRQSGAQSSTRLANPPQGKRCDQRSWRAKYLCYP
jgi:hypothetical protein